MMILITAVILRSESRGTLDHILLFQIRDSTNLEGQVPVFISSRKRVARLCPQALGPLSVTSYNTQGYSSTWTMQSREPVLEQDADGNV
jgi:hypothetical protein